MIREKIILNLEKLWLQEESLKQLYYGIFLLLGIQSKNKV